jgi:hypothetical protein
MNKLLSGEEIAEISSKPLNADYQGKFMGLVQKGCKYNNRF